MPTIKTEYPHHYSLPEDRNFKVPAGFLVKTEYVDLSEIILDCKEPMAIGDVQIATDRLRAAWPGQPFPTPYGYWSDSRFHIKDGRHAYAAALLLGYERLLVAYIVQ